MYRVYKFLLKRFADNSLVVSRLFLGLYVLITVPLVFIAGRVFPANPDLDIMSVADGVMLGAAALWITWSFYMLFWGRKRMEDRYRQEQIDQHLKRSSLSTNGARRQR